MKDNRKGFLNNSEAVYLLNNSLYNIMKDNFSDNDEFKNLINNYNYIIENINKSDIKSKK